MHGRKKVPKRGHSGQVKEHASNDENVPVAALQAWTSHSIRPPSGLSAQLGGGMMSEEELLID